MPGFLTLDNSTLINIVESIGGEGKIASLTEAQLLSLIEEGVNLLNTIVDSAMATYDVDSIALTDVEDFESTGQAGTYVKDLIVNDWINQRDDIQVYKTPEYSEIESDDEDLGEQSIVSWANDLPDGTTVVALTDDISFPWPTSINTVTTVQSLNDSLEAGNLSLPDYGAIRDDLQENVGTFTDSNLLLDDEEAFDETQFARKTGATADPVTESVTIPNGDGTFETAPLTDFMTPVPQPSTTGDVDFSDVVNTLKSFGSYVWDEIPQIWSDFLESSDASAVTVGGALEFGIIGLIGVGYGAELNLYNAIQQEQIGNYDGAAATLESFWGKASLDFGSSLLDSAYSLYLSSGDLTSLFSLSNLGTSLYGVTSALTVGLDAFLYNDSGSDISLASNDGGGTSITFSGIQNVGTQDVNTITFDYSSTDVLTECDQENANGTSQITIYDADGSSTTTDYSGPDGTGSITQVDQENSNGTSTITIYNLDGSSTTTTYSGSHGTGPITRIDMEGSASSSVSTIASATYNYTGGEMSGTIIYNPDTGGIQATLYGGGYTFNSSSSGGISVNSQGQVVGWDIQAFYAIDGGLYGMAAIADSGGQPQGVGGESYEYIGPPPPLFPAYDNLDASVSWSAGPVTTALTISPLDGQTQELSDVLANPNLTEQGSVQNLTINGSGTVELDGTVTISNLEISSQGTFTLKNGSLIADPVEVDADGNISGYGTIAGSDTVNGTITASGGTLDITGDIGGTGTLTFEVGASLILEGTVAATESLIFTGGGETLTLGANADVQSTISGLQSGDAIRLEGQQVTSAVYDPDTGQLAVTGGGSPYDLGLAGAYQQSNFTVQDGEVMVVCFLRGTQIATPAGEFPVERLSPGDEVLTANGSARRIVWIGEGRVLATRGRRTAATPVIVRKGALADNVPHHDLHVTKAHSLYIDGVLIPVEFLVNHLSIIWDDHAQEVSLYHIELETHDVLLANGAPAESYRDDGNRWLFQNANSGWGLPPQAPCAPVLTGGPVVDAIWRRLLERACPGGGMRLTDDPDLHLSIDGKRVNAIERRNDMHVFRLSSRPQSVRVCSRAAAPQELGLARDPRVLGVAVRRIVVADRQRQWALAAVETTLAEGFYPFEPDSGIRWTDGDAAVPPELFASMNGPAMLMLHLGGTTQYPDDGRAVRMIA